MRVTRPIAVFLGVLLVAISSLAQTTSGTSDPQAVQLLQIALSALVGTTSISDVTLSGSAHRIAGSDDESGSAVLLAASGGQSLVSLSLSGGSRKEVRTSSGGIPSGNWSGPDGVVHAISYHNLMTDACWFFPAFTLASVTSNQAYVASYVGQETLNGQTIQHVSVYLQTNSGSNLIEHLSRMDFYLDATTLLPAALAFNAHPDNDAGLDIPIRIEFSNYRLVNGAQVPLRVQKYLNNGLLLDLHFQTVAFNRGLTASAFSIQ